ncbi:uncharacterized protein LOC134655323 [Cydia amplana]|uniref:uncharacterized protein LOC134655323 n=1 Tax=Cydia amplana TaxID=1869771 RepID=UPI002FE5B6D7
MSGFLDVKYPFKSNLGLNPFKTWKRQWCILRPSPTCAGGGSLAVYCSEAGASAGAVELPPDSVVRRAKSRSRPFAFAVFSAVEPHKPRILLAAQTLQDAQLWMDKIRALLDGKQLLGSTRDSFSVTIMSGTLSRKLMLCGDGQLTITTDGVVISRSRAMPALIPWKHVHDVTMCDDKNRIVVGVNSDFHNGGSLTLSSPLAAEIAAALNRDSAGRARRNKRLSRSEADLRVAPDGDLGDIRRSSWSTSGPPEVALDDTDLAMMKETPAQVQLSRCAGAGHLPSPAPQRVSRLHADANDDSMSDRRSLLSVASGIYEEIPDPPDQLYTAMSRDHGDGPAVRDNGPAVRDHGPAVRDNGTSDKCSVKGGTSDKCSVKCGTSDKCSVKCGTSVERVLRPDEPMYESVAECVYATMRRTGKKYPPPLPPRLPFGTMKLGESWNSRINTGDAVTRHSSLGSLPRCCSVSSTSSDSKTKTLPKSTRQAFSVFRKRLKSDSRIMSPKSETAKENKDVETKKKKFDFTPTRDIFKNFKVSRKMKNLKIAPGSLSKVGETKSCEFLDETEHVTTARCSKSVESLEPNDEFDFDADLSLEFNDDSISSLALPQEILDLILRSEHMNKIRLKHEMSECDYMPMSPICPPAPIEHHYIAMSPSTNLA